jgi:NADH-quinone oxidoreductase subunit J
MIDDIGVIIAFYILAGTSLVCALLVAFARNLIHAVLFLALTFVGVAGVYVVLSADFVAVVQVLIYAGAVGVLMTFAIMLTPASDRQNAPTMFQIPAALLAVLVAGVTIYVAYDTEWAISGREAFVTTARALGDAFLEPYVVAFEVASVLLVTAMIGAIILTREEHGDEA